MRLEIAENPPILRVCPILTHGVRLAVCVGVDVRRRLAGVEDVSADSGGDGLRADGGDGV